MERQGVPAQYTLDLLHFKINVAEALVCAGKPQAARKRGRPSTSSLDEAVQIFAAKERLPIEEVRMDMMVHMPNFDNKKEATRCKLPHCTGRTRLVTSARSTTVLFQRETAS